METEVQKKPKGGNRVCAVCKICQESPEANRIVHEVKFQEILTLGDVCKRLEIVTGKPFTIAKILNHYQCHLDKIDPTLSIEYKKQAQMLSGPGEFKKHIAEARENGTQQRRHALSITKFDAIEQLKSMYVDLNSRLLEMRGKEGKDITPLNIKTYSEIIEELRKIAGDIAKVELDREYVGKVILEVYKGVAHEIVKKIGDAMRDVVCQMTTDEKAKEKAVDAVREATTKALIAGIDKLEKDLSQRL